MNRRKDFIMLIMRFKLNLLLKHIAPKFLLVCDCKAPIDDARASSSTLQQKLNKITSHELQKAKDFLFSHRLMFPLSIISKNQH